MKSSKHGFTIIEVVLVLAIAGLIFLAVFIALPTLQRSQRNTRRRQDVARIASAVTAYQSANNKLPFYLDNSDTTNNHRIDANFIPKYIDENCKNSTSDKFFLRPNISYESCGDQFTDPDGTPYILFYYQDTAKGYRTGKSDIDKSPIGSLWNNKIENNDSSRHVIYVHTSAKCSDNEISLIKTSGHNDFALRYLLEGGSVYCVDNS